MGPAWCVYYLRMAASARRRRQLRDRVLRRLVAACADGYLAHDELATRSAAADRAGTLPELAGLVADLPGPGQAAVREHCRGIRKLIVSVLGIAGHWPFQALAARAVAAAVLGELVIDLRHTAVTSFETDLTVVAVAGEVHVVVPAGFRVEPGHAVTVFGRTAGTMPHSPGDALTPVIRLRCLAVLGNVLTRHAPAVA